MSGTNPRRLQPQKNDVRKLGIGVEVDLPNLPRLAFASILQKMDRLQAEVAFSLQLLQAFAVMLFRERLDDMPCRQGDSRANDYSGAKRRARFSRLTNKHYCELSYRAIEACVLEIRDNWLSVHGSSSKMRTQCGNQ